MIILDDKPYLWNVDPPKQGKGSIEDWWKEWRVERFKVFEVVVPRPGECEGLGSVSGGLALARDAWRAVAWLGSGVKTRTREADRIGQYTTY
jgi:hypothetical protein